MATRISYIAERYNLLHKEQFGGQPQRSVIDAVMFLTTLIDNAKMQ